MVPTLMPPAVEAEALLQTQTADALDRHSEDGDVVFRGEQRADLRGRRGGEGDDALGAFDGRHEVMVPTL